MLLSSPNTLTDTPRIMSDQICGHSGTQSSCHIKLTITISQIEGTKYKELVTELLAKLKEEKQKDGFTQDGQTEKIALHGPHAPVVLRLLGRCCSYCCCSHAAPTPQEAMHLDPTASTGAQRLRDTHHCRQCC